MTLAGCLGGGGSDSPEPPDSPVNTPPTANAGGDKVAAAGSMVNLDGGGSSDAGGTIASYAWTQTGGPAVTLASAGTATPSFTAPDAPGTLTFQLTVTDNGGASHSDTVTVTVNAIPVANAGADQTVSAGAAVSLAGSATDADGAIASYAWTQTSGPAVTLSGANSATATFTAPASAATLAFDLAATDDRGATHVDPVTITVTALTAPVIARHPNNALALEHGSAMMFVAAAGTGLTYEWRRGSGTVVKTGPEPFLLVTNLNLFENDDCYYVVVSNTAGTATSEEGCLTVEDIDWLLDPSDDPDNADDRSYALGYGEAQMKIVQTVTGPLTGRTGGALRLGFPVEFGPPEECYLGSYEGTTLDGVMVTPGATLPLGHHTLTESWNECLTDPDDTDAKSDAYMVEYDFPQTWGVGTLTIHVSERYFNGTVHATVVANEVNGNRSDDIDITIAEDFSVGDLSTGSEQSISVDRRYSNDGLGVDEVYVSLNIFMRAFDANGGAGTIGVHDGGSFHLRQHFDEGDSGDPEFTSTGTMDVGLSGYVLASIEPSGTATGWGFVLLPEEECPEGQICVDPPTP